jgi:hypothetical protein
METDVENRTVSLWASRRRFVIAAFALLLALFLVRPGVSRLKSRIANSISLAVARPVEIGSVQLRFLPPGFDLENLVVEEDPAFGAEPMLHASEVTAVIRLTSLLHGRLDVARLELTEPSLNLVRRADGRWNWESLLERTARTPLAPTAKSKREPRPGFPYIEASSGRINFKVGQVKKPYALLDADFSLWQESENAWGVRLQAKPLRTDTDLNDAGILRVNGTWQRAASLRDTPLQFTVEWNRAPLGQVTKLISGYDKGWRGEVQLDTVLSGTPGALQVNADASIDQFHRYDISSAGGMSLRAHCVATYSSAENMVHEVFCNAPAGNGTITVHGDAGLPGVHRIDLALNLDNVPMNAAAQFALRTKQNLPADLAAAGTIQGDFVARQDGAAQAADFHGQGEISDLRVRSLNNQVDLVLGTVPFVLASAKDAKAKNSHSGPLQYDALHVDYGPFAVPLGRAALAQVHGWIGRSGYSMTIRGPAEIARVLRVANVLGVPALKADAEGTAQLDVLVSGSWAGSLAEGFTGFSPPQVTGSVQLHDARASVHGINGPIEIASAELQLSSNQTLVDKLRARAGNALWTGSLSLPRGCSAENACRIQFSLNGDQVSMKTLADWLRPPENERRWYQVLADSPRPSSFLRNLQAAGTLSTNRMLIRDVIANRVSASVDLQRGILKISDLRADVLGGKYRGNWQIDFSGGTPAYSGTGTLTSISLAQIADAMHDPWISGTASGSYELKVKAADPSSFWKSLEASLQFDLRDTTLPRVVLNTGDAPLRIARWQGRALLRDEKLEIEKSKLISPSATYAISGTASFARDWNLKLTQDNGMQTAHASATVYSIGGTISAPIIEAVSAPQTQAQLKR